MTDGTIAGNSFNKSTQNDLVDQVYRLYDATGTNNTLSNWLRVLINFFFINKK